MWATIIMPQNSHRTTLYQGGTARVDVQVSGLTWLAEIRLWRGARWPDLERRWFAVLRPWLPWFSLETQTKKALVRATGNQATLLAWQEARAGLDRFRRGAVPDRKEA